jgi:hypothetical protein
MQTALALTVAYLAVNLALMVWIERERAHEREISWQLGMLTAVLRYGPPLAGVIYLLTISGDWIFALFVVAFFGIAAWLMNGLLAYTSFGPDGRGDTRRNRR